MHTHRPFRGLLLVIGLAAACIPASAAEEESRSATHMSEELRSSVTSLVVIAGPTPAQQEITGSYEKSTPGLAGGISQGAAMGSPSAQVGPVNVSFPFPILTLPGALIGGISGKTRRDIQEFRDALTEDLARAKNQPLTNSGLALDVYRDLQTVPGLESKLYASSTPIPEDTHAILYVSVKDVTIDVQGTEAILTASAEVTLQRLSDEKDLYKRVIRYQDRDSLSNWTKNENALWRDYANFARHYLGREIAAEVFNKVELDHELRPQESATLEQIKKNDWQGVSQSTTPTLAWELTLLGGDSYGSWTDEINESNTYYDVEIYDTHRLVYSSKQLPDPVHTVGFEIDACKTYRWSVRPSYHIGNDIKYGEWMKYKSASDPEAGADIVGRKASAAPAYVQNFASLKIECD
jgi:hypothetical protein